MSEQFRKFAEHTETYNLDIQCAMSGSTDSKIVIIGEYPGEQEVAFNRPFVGASGRVLWNCLRKYKISLANCYTTNLVKRRVSAKMPVLHGEFTLWKEALEFELSQLHDVEVIIALGNSVISALLGFEGIQKYRGSVYDYNGIKVVCANNPAVVIRDPSQEIIFEMDMARAAEVINGDYKEHHITKIINPTFEEAMQYIEAIRVHHKEFAIDIEVVGGETACIGLAHSAHHAMCINFRDRHQNRYNMMEEFAIMQAFAKLCDDPTTISIAQNGNFDSYFMGYKDQLIFRVNFDTLLAHHTLYPRLPHNLGFLTAQYTTHSYYKDEKDTFKEGGDIDNFWRYNCTDAAITFAVAQKEKQELLDQGLYDFFMNHVMFLHPNLAEATVAGIAIDMEKREEIAVPLRIELNEHYNHFITTVRAAVKDPEYIVNPNSPKQMSALFFDKLNCKGTTRSTAAPVRENWLKDPRVNPEVRDVIIALNKYTEEHKFYSTYVDTQIDADNRFRSEYKQYGVSKAPGRLSSSQTLWGSGGNAQNQPKRAYEMFVADPDTVFIYFDLAQAEARYVGWDANIEKWKEDFERARLDGIFDAHRSLAASMFNTPYDDVPLEDIDDQGQFTIRYIAKRCRHGLNYRMQPARLAQTTGLTFGQAAKNYHAYHRTNPELQVWWRTLEETVKKKRMLFNSLNRRLLFTERLDNDEALESIIAFRPQSTIGDKVGRVWAQCHADDRWDRSKARIAINIHDALWGISTPEFAHTALSIMKAYAEQPIMVTSIVTNKTEPMIIPADLKITAINDQPRSMANMEKIKLEAAKL